MEDVSFKMMGHWGHLDMYKWSYGQKFTCKFLPDITGRTALAVQPDVVNAKYHVITNATYNRDPVPAKFKHVTNIDTCTLLAVITARCGKLCM